MALGALGLIEYSSWRVMDIVFQPISVFTARKKTGRVARILGGSRRDGFWGRRCKATFDASGGVLVYYVAVSVPMVDVM